MMSNEAPLSITLQGMTWHFSTKARVEIWLLGAITPKQMRAFVKKILDHLQLREGTTEINLNGTGLRITKRGQEFTVETLAEIPSR
jgi:hypothetical protein